MTSSSINPYLPDQGRFAQKKKILEVHVCSSFDEGAEEPQRGGSVGADVMGCSFVIVAALAVAAAAAAVDELS